MPMSTVASPGRSLRLAVDIGGTFTDLVALDSARGGELVFGKSLSTHESLMDGIENCAEIAGVAFDEVELFLHGSTIAINTLLERTGADTFLLTTEGFRDVYEIGRINRPDAYNLFFRKHQPLIKRSKRVEISERILADGSVYKALDETAVRSAAGDMRARGAQAVAVMCLHAYRNPQHEQRVRTILEEELPGVFVSMSHELTREYREFERTSTVVANAYIGPRVRTYVEEIEQRLADHQFSGDFFVVQSTGGLFPAADAKQSCIRMLESGPAAGVIGAQALCSHIGMPDAIAFDMGGTTAKAGLIRDYKALTSGHAMIGRYGEGLPIQLPMIDIFEVGTGGGSIAAVEEGGALRVGPRSAGSNPGPASYGKGDEPTVTDANVVLGRLDPDHFLGGTMRLDKGRAYNAIRTRLAEPLGLDVIAAAQGVLKIASVAMSYAVKGVTTERGLDAGSFAMIVYGGAGPLHASMIAREIGIDRVIIPFAPGYFSAYGMLFGDIRYDYVRSCFRRLDAETLNDLVGMQKEMVAEGRAAIAAGTFQCEDILVRTQADMRHVGQEHAITVAIDRDAIDEQRLAEVREAFDREHLARYGVIAPEEDVEVVSLRTSIHGIVPKPNAVALGRADNNLEKRALIRRQKTYFDDTTPLETRVYARAALLAGDCLRGPALIEEHASTTVLQPGDLLEVDSAGNLHITIGNAS